MNEFYRSFVETAKSMAFERGLQWDLPYNESGKIPKDKAWDLGALAGMVPPPFYRIIDLGFDAAALTILNSIREQEHLPSLSLKAMPAHWRDLYQAVVLTEVLIKRNKPQHAIINIGRYIRLLATCVEGRTPWDITGTDVQLAYNVALKIGESGKIAANFSMVVRIVIDGQHLADRTPLARFCIPFPTDTAREAQSRVEHRREIENSYQDVEKVRTELGQRKASEKLPEAKAFWELIRILWTEKPLTLSDHIRFAQAKIAVLTGFRVGENATIPFDWERWREYVDAHGHPAGESGGISRSLMLRHFAEKQPDDEGPKGVVLYETAQHIPQIFEQEVLAILRHCAEITQPMRDRLRRQTETGRLFPEFESDALIPAPEMYIRVSGALPIGNHASTQQMLETYRAAYEPTVLDKLRETEMRTLRPRFINTVKTYWNRYLKKGEIFARDEHGKVFPRRVCSWRDAYFRVGDVEDLVRRCMPTKLPDVEPFTLADGTTLFPYELLFLMPIRALAENRNDGLTDVSLNFANGRVSSADLHMHLGGQADNLFSRYGKTKADRSYTLNTHSLRHLQNTELIRLGVADTIVNLRFNRRDPKQLKNYDHRSLAEDLQDIDLPPLVSEKLGPRAQEAMRMIVANKVCGPIVEEFRQIQREHGDDAAYDYLDAEADGLHVTPYGFCLNSFTVDPCPKHLECFNGCTHLTRSNVPEERKNLESLRDRTKRAITKIEASPSGSIGRENQILHAREHMSNIEKVLAAEPGSRPFPDGKNLFRAMEDKTGTTIFDI